jgi:hypothetical protein
LHAGVRVTFLHWNFLRRVSRNGRNAKKTTMAAIGPEQAALGPFHDVIYNRGLQFDTMKKLSVEAIHSNKDFTSEALGGGPTSTGSSSPGTHAESEESSTPLG